MDCEGFHMEGTYKDQAILCATELFYPAIVIKKLESARSDIEIQHIMTDARNGVYGGIYADDI